MRKREHIVRKENAVFRCSCQSLGHVNSRVRISTSRRFWSQFEKETHMQTIDSMGKLREIKGYVRLTLDKLPGIKSDLERQMISSMTGTLKH